MARVPFAVFLGSLVLLLSTLGAGPTPYGWASSDPRIVDASVVDTDGDKISDFLAEKVADQSMATVQAEGATLADLIVSLDHAPTAADVGAVQSLGGSVPDSWKDLLYAIHVLLPVDQGKVSARLEELKAAVTGLVVIEENARSESHLYMSTQQTGARYIWTSYGVDGDSTTSIAIMDTGVTIQHADIPGPFPGKVAAWNDQIGATPTPADFAEHGTHVAGIAAGLGSAAGLSAPGSTGWVYVGYDQYFHPSVGYGWIERHPIDTRSYGVNATIGGSLNWIDNRGGSYTVYFDLFDSVPHWLSGGSALNELWPLMTSYSGVYSAPGIYDYRYFAQPKCTVGNNNVSPTWTLIDAPMSGIGDGYNLMSGVAPGCALVGVKVLNDYGTGTSTQFLNGLTWIRTNAVTYGIKVVNMSMGFGSIVGAVDTMVNTAVDEGLVMVASAGNSRSGGAGVGSPASASKCIAVAATSHTDRITDYSCYGGTGSKKPDVAAPGGTTISGDDRDILSVDSGDGEHNYDPSTSTYYNYSEAWVEDDYRHMHGTSMSCPFVSGAAALLDDAMGGGANPLHIKMLLCMTATETNQTAEAAPNPTLNRGAKDVSEGYGKMNIDAAIEAVTLSHTIGGGGDSDTLGATSTDNLVFNKQCWARTVTVSQDTAYQFDLVVPGTGDFDMYLYDISWTDDASTSDGEVGGPVILASSTSASTGTDERINYDSCTTQLAYIVVKRVSGSGMFTLTSQSYYFEDVTPQHPFKGAIQAMKDNVITSGCAANGTCADSYCPTSTVTRGQMASFICKAAGKTWYDPGSATFGDVPRGTNGVWDGGGGGGYDVDGTFIFYGWIERLADPASWGGTAPTGGCAGGNYCPANGVTRGQMSKFLCIAAGQTWYDPGSATFGDVSRGSNGTYDTPETDGTHVFYGYVERLADAASWGGTAVTGGCGSGNYCPTNPVTRGQMAIFLCRAFAIPF